jgi:hypothetical protein
LLALALPAIAQPPSERIGTIDFYGYGTLDIAALRAALPFHESDKLPSGSVKQAAEEALQKLSGRQAAVSSVCCLLDGRSSVFVGLAGPDAPAVHYNPAPKGESRLPANILKTFQQFDEHFYAAVVKGPPATEEDDSQGYALIKDPATHADQLKVRAWAQANIAAILEVLEGSRYPDQRVRAAEALGYADRSPRQIAALVDAAFDADENIRNAAVRALTVLCRAGAEAASQIPAARFIPLLHSITWTDRNKGAALLDTMTVSRNPALLRELHDQALEALREMAQWNDFNHAWFSLRVLGRVAGIEESRLARLDPSQVGEILRAAK